jgi:hypothetical protein
MKSGTTSLYRWLGDRGDVFVPTIKEPNFFSEDRVWRKGVTWYASLFTGADSARAVGEASVSYTDPARAVMSAGRIAEVLPEVRLVYVVRDPVERLRSHYRHEVQRGREQRPLREALMDPQSPYVAWSRYHLCLQPYLERFSEERVCVVPFEELVTEERLGWGAILKHLNLPHQSAPVTRANVTAGKRGFTRLARMLWDSGLLAKAQRLPRPIRRMGRRILLSNSDRYRDLLATSEEPLPSSLTNDLAEEADLLARTLGWSESPWRRSTNE